MIRPDPALQVGSPAVSLSMRIGNPIVSLPQLPDIAGMLAYDLTDVSAMSVERGGTGGEPGVGTLVGRVESVGTLDVPMIATADTARPTRREGSLEFNGVTSELEIQNNFSSHVACTVIISAKNDDDRSAIWWYRDGGDYDTIHRGSDSVPSIKGGAVSVNRVPALSQTVLLGLTFGAGWVVLSCEATNLDSWQDFRIGKRSAGFELSADIAALVILPTGYTQTHFDQAYAWAQHKAGITP